MVDQRVSEGLKATFGAQCLLRLPAQLSIRFNCDIIPIYISRDKNNNFEMEILNQLIFPENRKKDKYI